ncbi:nuclease-related domain-containing DEAD/DEAH box helicase [Mesotoga prima]|uniref:nuclease-related domain-containing DEAD/DEAH box helicase n=1 Tax=Mesotoga prima TaxID=1184387 RepID=UPI001BD5352A|nr:UvrD-helicase domain-containing protein [Mesotoga prima]HQC15057.1 AAA family ATPase [Mesotoga prima]
MAYMVQSGQSGFIPNKGEEAVLDWLRGLPDSCYVYRELRISLSETNERKPDFIVVSKELGVICIEVKDWNLDSNTYIWKNQQVVERRSIASGKSEEITNPFSQACEYKFLVFETLRKAFIGDVSVDFVVAFPRITRQSFLNKVQGVKTNYSEQSRFMFDPGKTLFKEDLKPGKNVADVLKTKTYNRNSVDEATLNKINKVLLPDAYRIDSYHGLIEYRNELERISRQQARWIFGLDKKVNYLLDVPGSGKTNALVSRAISLVKSNPESPPKILLTTYNRNLSKNIEKVLKAKISGSPNESAYLKSIVILSMPDIMKMICSFASGCGPDIDSLSEDALREYVKKILIGRESDFKKFDHIFVDEIQDFDDFYILVLKHLCRQEDFFFVGDIGQKIYERDCNLDLLGFPINECRVEKSFKMYRSPKYVSRLAIDFINKDPLLKYEFTNNGYRDGQIEFVNTLDSAAEIYHVQDSIGELLDRVSSMNQGLYSADDLMIVTSPERLEEVNERLNSRGIKSEIGEPHSTGCVCCVDFLNVKGLERRVVIINRIEDLYSKFDPINSFGNETEKNLRDSLSRRMIYVAMTRTTEELVILCEDPKNSFVRDLLELNGMILKERERIHFGNR